VADIERGAHQPLDDLDRVEQRDLRASADVVDPPGAQGAVLAAIVPATTSPTKVKSRVCSPSPKTVIGSPASAASKKRLKAMSGRCRGPKTEK